VIPVRLQPEPDDFEAKVRQKGLDFLNKFPHPKNWNNRDYWRHSLDDLYRVYGRTCAYSAQWIPRN